MPDSKLVEKLGKLFATISEGGPKHCTCRLEKFVDGPIPCVTCQFKDAENELRNLCLELSERLELWEIQRNASIETERNDAERALGTLAGAHICTPVEGYGTNSSWAISDLCRAVKELSERLAEKEKKA